MLVQPLSFWHHIPWLYAGEKSLSRDTYIECFRMILPRCNATARGGFGATVLHEVAAMRDYVSDDEALEFAAAALGAGARLDVRDDLLLSTPLGWACRWGRTALVELFLRHGADAVEADAESWATPRAWATKKGRGEIAALLAR
jgi:hypothetical protein